jgi:undecaprenyl-diphosphatase
MIAYDRLCVLIWTGETWVHIYRRSEPSRRFRALRELDCRVSSWLFRRNSGLVAIVAAMLSAAGSDRVFVPCAAGAALAGLFERQFVGAAALTFVTVITKILISAFKARVHRIRPAVSQLGSSSFPSGHTMASGAVYGTAAFVLTHCDWSWMIAITASSGVLAAAIGTARVVRGFHWMTDIAAGVALGLALLIIVCFSISRL